MILGHPFGRRVRMGQKTVVRLPVAQKKIKRPKGTPDIKQDARCPYEPEHFYQVRQWKTELHEELDDETGKLVLTERKGAPVPICHIRVVSVEVGRLADMTEEDAAAEGFESLAEFRDAWWERYRWGWNSPRDVWVVRFVVEHDLPRLLAERGGTTHSTAQAMKHEPEAVDEATEQRYADEARESFAVHLERERAERKERELGERLNAVQDLAAKKGVDLTRKLTSIERRIESAEREVGRE